MALELNLQKGLIGHWTMNNKDTSGEILYDSSSQDNHGNINNTISTAETSIIGESFDFNVDGNNGYVFFDNLGISNTKITISLWARIETVGSKNYMFDTGSPRNSLIKWGDGNTNQIIWRIAGDVDFYTQGDRVGEWVHYAIQSDGTTETLYVDSVEVSSKNQTQSTVSFDELYIGEFNGLGYSANGNISDFRIYNRTLSKEEISALYNMRSQRNASI